MSKRKRLTSVDIKNEVRRVLRLKNTQDDSQDFEAGVILLSSLIAGPYISRVSKFTGFSKYKVSKYAQEIKSNGIWKNGKVHANWFDKENGGLEFAMDIAVARGFLGRVR